MLKCHNLCIPAVRYPGEFVVQRENILVVTRKSVRTQRPVRPRIVEHTQEAQFCFFYTLAFSCRPAQKKNLDSFAKQLANLNVTLILNPRQQRTTCACHVINNCFTGSLSILLSNRLSRIFDTVYSLSLDYLIMLHLLTALFWRAYSVLAASVEQPTY